jgi:hypothetical protein
MEREDNKAVEKVGDLYSDLGTKEQSKDSCSNLRVVERNIGLISDPDLDNDLLKKLSIAFKPFNLGVKILENAFYIVIKSDIHIYSKHF